MLSQPIELLPIVRSKFVKRRDLPESEDEIIGNLAMETFWRLCPSRPLLALMYQ